MNEPTMDNMVQRLDRLERENHRLKRIGALVLVGIAAVVLMGQARPSKVAKVIEAEKFILRDEAGKVRAMLDASTSPRTSFTLLDVNGVARAGLWLGPDGSPALILSGKEGEGRAELTVRSKGSLLEGPELQLSHGRGSVSIGATPNSASLYLSNLWKNSLRLAVNSDGNVNIRVGQTVLEKTNYPKLPFVDKSRFGFQLLPEPLVYFSDKNFTPRTVLGLSDEGRPFFQLMDKNEQRRASMMIEDDGKPSFVLHDKSGNKLVELSEYKDGPRLAFIDKDQKLRAILGFQKDFPILALQGKNGTLRAILMLDGGDFPSLLLRDKEGRDRVQLTGPDYGIYLVDQNGRNRTVLGMKEGTKGSPGLWLYDKDGKSRAAMALKEDGSPTFGLYDKSGAVLAQESSTTRPSGPVWVLWSQTEDLSLALSAWPTRAECVAQIQGKQEHLIRENILVTCLPDTVNLRGKR